MDLVRNYFRTVAIAAALLCAAPLAVASPASDPTFTDIGSPIQGLQFAVGLSSDLHADSAVDLSNPTHLVVSNAGGTNFRFEVKITGDNLTLGSLTSIFDPAANKLVGGTIGFGFGSDSFAITGTVLPLDDLVIVALGGNTINDPGVILEIDFRYGQDPASSVTFDLCCNVAGAPFAFPAVEVVPEPGTLALISSGLLAFALRRRTQRTAT